MKIELLMECVDTLNRLDIDNPDNQKAISVCENYILHSYKLYYNNCISEGYEPLSEQDYMLEVLALNEGILKKLAIGAGLVATGLAAKKGYNAINQNAIAQGGQGGLSNVVGNTKQFFRQSGGAGAAAKNIFNTSLKAGRAAKQYQGVDRQTTVTRQNMGQDENGNNLGTKTTNQYQMNVQSRKQMKADGTYGNQGSRIVKTVDTDKDGNTTQTTTHTINRDKKGNIKHTSNVEKPQPAENQNAQGSTQDQTKPAENQNTQQSTEQTKPAENQNAQGSTQPAENQSTQEQTASKKPNIVKRAGGAIVNTGKKIISGISNKFRGNKEAVDNAKNGNNNTATPNEQAAGQEKAAETQASTPAPTTEQTSGGTTPQTNQTADNQQSQETNEQSNKVYNSKRNATKLIQQDNMKEGQIIEYNENTPDGKTTGKVLRGKVVKDKNGKLKIQSIDEELFLEYLNLCNDDVLVAYGKTKFKKYELESKIYDDIDIIQEMYYDNLLSYDEFYDLMEEYKTSQYFNYLNDYICEHWYNASRLTEPLTPSIRSGAKFTY